MTQAAIVKAVVKFAFVDFNSRDTFLSPLKQTTNQNKPDSFIESTRNNRDEGQFKFGSKDHYSPEYLLDHGIILVTVNYRLGVFGKCELLVACSSCVPSSGDAVALSVRARDTRGLFGSASEQAATRACKL